MKMVRYNNYPQNNTCSSNSWSNNLKHSGEWYRSYNWDYDIINNYSYSWICYEIRSWNWCLKILNSRIRK